MDPFISAIITPVVDSLMVPIKKTLGFWISSPKHVKDMDAKMKQLKDLSREVEVKRDTAFAKTEMVPERMEPWLKDVEKINRRAKSIPTGALGCFNVSKRYRAGKRSFEILKEIEDLITRESNINFTKEKISLAKVPSTSQDQQSTSAQVHAPALDDTHYNFTSRDVLFRDAWKSLQSSEETQRMIALCGTGGVGKTTMMEQLKKAVEDSKMFDWVVKVVVGENSDPIALQRAIAEYIDKDLSETDKDARADRLRKKFEGMSQKGQKKILVIVDDVWKEINLKDVGLTNPLPNGFKMLFTSRDKNLCYRMGVKTNSVFDVRVLDFEEAKTLFFGIVGSSILDGDDPEYQKIGEDIVNECGGLPIALKTIARYLRYRVKDAWKEALSNLQHDDLKHLKEIVHKVFEISYDNLETDDDKAIFLLCGLFPDDFNIPIEDLMQYGWGLKLFTNVYTLVDARRRTNICVDNLIRTNLLTESETKGYVKMHDLIRAFVLSNFAKVKQASIVNHVNKSRKPLTEDAYESYDRILLKCTSMPKLPADFNFPNLSLLILMGGHEGLKFPDDFYDRMKNLEVISFEKMSISLLPVKFEHLSKLRTLSLRSCSFETDDICVLGSLSNLEILSFVNCEINRLPFTIGKLKKLKSLYLDGFVDLCIDDGVFQNLSSLEELYMVTSWRDQISFTHTNYEELENLSHNLFALEFEFFKNGLQPKNVSFKNLERFRISIGCQLSCNLFEKEVFRNTLYLEAECDMLLECKISELFEKTEELFLQVNDMNNFENVSMHHSFSNLTVLHVCGCTELTYLFTAATANGLKKLEQLKILGCPKMTTLIGENSKDGVVTFPKMNIMSLDDLPNMIRLCENVIELPEMVELIIDGLPKFTSIFPDSNNSSEMQLLSSKKVVIPKLQRLNISTMENLKQLWPYQITKERSYVSMLREIKVTNCDNLVNLFPNNPLPLLNHLEELILAECDSIEVLFNMDFESATGMWECSGSRLKSIIVENLKKLKELWLIRGVNNSDVLIDNFKGVERIVIRSCPMFERVFTPTTIKFDLGALTRYITNSTGIEINTTLKGEISEMDEHIPNVTYPSYLLHRCHHLRHLDLNNDERVEVIFEMDSHQPLLLPYLEDLSLTCLKEMSHVWKCYQNKFLIPQHQPLQFPFQNLKNIYLRDCQKIKYLLSPLVAKYLSNLKTISINKCDGIEEIISSRDDANEENTTSTSSQDQNIIFFPRLNTFSLHFLSCLKSIDDQSQRGPVLGACWSLCQYPIDISIDECPALSILIPWYAVAQMKRLQKLDIWNCETMVEIFESETSTNNVDEGGAHGGAVTTLTTPTLKNSPTVVTPQLSNLTRVRIYKCDLLSHVFTFSTLESLKQLKQFSVQSCKAMQEIVKEEKGTSSKEVVFPSLETLILVDLPNLKGFFLGMNEFRWPLLTDVRIADCPQLMMFTSGKSKTPKLKYIYTSLGKHSVECGLNFHGTISEYQTTFPTSSSSSSDPTISKGMPWSFHNLVEIDKMNERVGAAIIPSNVLLQLEKLEKIHLDCCYYVEEVFEVIASKENESQTIVKIPIPYLTQVELIGVYDLKYLWKRNQLMVLEFPNLTTLSIRICHKLEHVFTCSMVSSLVQLQDLEISYCDNIEVIVKEEEEECDAEVNEIMLLPHLKSLMLVKLQSLKGFCLGKEAFSLRALDTLQILQCPEITGFTNGQLSTPELNVIDTSFGKYHIKPDLNSFIKSKQEEGYEF